VPQFSRLGFHDDRGMLRSIVSSSRQTVLYT
jgi:hypothetical protein